MEPMNNPIDMEALEAIHNFYADQLEKAGLGRNDIKPLYQEPITMKPVFRSPKWYVRLKWGDKTLPFTELS